MSQRIYQYVAMTPVQFSATGTGTVFFFTLDSELPLGLSFDSATNRLIGTPMVAGLRAITVYAKDDGGVTEIRLTIDVLVPLVIRQQTSAGAWTSLTRQYTIVNAAQNSVNGKTLPSTQPPLGEFMRPHPPDSVSAEGDPNCVRKCD
jgi:hypothetical protein